MSVPRVDAAPTNAAGPGVSAEPRRSFWRGALGESTGALGDLGTFLPLTVGMVQSVGFDPAAVLVTMGLAHIASAAVFRTPVAVQPMKALCALAIAGGLNHSQVLAAGLGVGLFTLLGGLSGLLQRAARAVPAPVISALQVGVAVQLLLGSVRLAAHASAGAWDNGALLLAGALFALALILHRRQGWVGIGLAAAGAVAAVRVDPGLLHQPVFAVWTPHFTHFDPSALSGLWSGAVPQLPLTLLNSVLAAAALSAAYFPRQRERNTPTRLAISTGLMNLIACPLGGLPICHGSGGLAGQYRMGARTGWSMVLLGLVQLALGVCCGATALAFMRAFPAPILAVFLMLAGAALVEASRFAESRRALVATSAAVCLQSLTGSLAWGFLAGWVADAVASRTARVAT